MRTTHAMSASLLLAAAISAQAQDDLKAFPPATAGMVRHVVQLTPQADESLLKAELIVGKTMKLDAHNRYFLGGRIEAQNIDGWGYTKYVVSALGPVAGTLMAIDPKTPKIDRFVALAGEPYLVRYNSRLPLVVYAPEGSEVRYRIWRAEPAMSVMPVQ